jgi:hypothetical protein
VAGQRGLSSSGLLAEEEGDGREACARGKKGAWSRDKARGKGGAVVCDDQGSSRLLRALLSPSFVTRMEGKRNHAMGYGPGKKREVGWARTGLARWAARGEKKKERGREPRDAAAQGRLGFSIFFLLFSFFCFPFSLESR